MATKSYFAKPQKFRQDLVRWAYTAHVFVTYLSKSVAGFKKAKPLKDVSTKAQQYVNLKAGGIHIHCASINEIKVVQGLVNEWLKAYPNTQITLSTPTAHYANFALNMFTNHVQHALIEFDISTYLQPFINALKPQVCLQVGASVWPNLIQICHQNSIPSALVNARMHNSDLIYAKRYAWFYRNTLRRFNAICAIDRESFENYLALGMYKPQLHISRNIKFDVLPTVEDETQGAEFASYFGFENELLLLGAGTSEAEELQLLNAFLALKEHHSSLRMVVVPLPQERYDNVGLKFRASGLETYKYNSYLNNEMVLDAALRPSRTPDCVVVDDANMLSALSTIATLSYIGSADGLLVGQNCMLGALNSKPMIINALGFKSDVVCDYLYDLNALVVVHNPLELHEAIEHWLTNQEQAELDGERGSKVLLRNGGAIEITMNVIHRLTRKYE